MGIPQQGFIKVIFFAQLNAGNDVSIPEGNLPFDFAQTFAFSHCFQFCHQIF